MSCHLQETWTCGSLEGSFLDITEIPVVPQSAAKDTEM